MSFDDSAPAWLARLEDLLCNRFSDLQHQAVQIREEIIKFVENIIKEDPARSSWEFRKLIWLLVEEWRTHGYTSLCFPEPCPPNAYFIDVISIGILCYLPESSSASTWDHASQCAGQLTNTFRDCINQQSVSFLHILKGRDINPPMGDPPQDAAPLGPLSRSSTETSDALPTDVRILRELLEKMKVEQTRARASMEKLQRQNIELALKLAETQQKLHEAQKALGLYEHS